MSRGARLGSLNVPCPGRETEAGPGGGFKCPMWRGVGRAVAWGLYSKVQCIMGNSHMNTPEQGHVSLEWLYI